MKTLCSVLAGFAALFVENTHTSDEVFVGWGWEGHSEDLDGCEIHVDRGTGFVLLTIDTRPGYLDTEPFPATSAVWKYKGIFRKDDQRVGLWSDVASIPVG